MIGHLGGCSFVLKLGVQRTDKRYASHMRHQFHSH